MSGTLREQRNLTVAGLITALGGTSGIDHGQLDGLSDDDHLQYLLRTQWYQNGFSILHTSPTLSFVDGTRTLSITPAVATFSYFVSGILYTKTGVQTFQISAVEGIHAVYYDGATLAESVNFSSATYDTIMATYTLVALVYWDAANSRGFLFKELHTSNMSPLTHTYLHHVFGARWNSGLALGDILPNLSGDLDTHAQFSAEAGVLYDEDLRHATNTIASTVGLQVWYRDTTNWRWVTSAGFSVLTTGTGRLAWNDAGALAEVPNGDFVLCHVFAWNGNDGNPIAIVGQSTYTTVGAARDGALVEIGNLFLTGLPTPEMKPVGTVIFQTSDAYANAVKGRIRTTDTGENYVDWRYDALTPSATAVDHGNLSGLGDDDHLQYARTDGTRSITGPQRFEKQIYQDVPATMTPAGTTQTVDWALGNLQILDLGSASGDVTLTFSNLQTGMPGYVLKVIQGAVARNVVWPATCKWPSGVTPTISTGNDDIDAASFVYDGTVCLMFGMAQDLA